MASTTQEGTGKHPHKSAAEPHEHHEAPSTTGKDAQHTSSSRSTAAHAKESSKSEASTRSEGSPTTEQNGSNLESRAYTGPDGKEHHHTTKYQGQHKGE